MGEQERDALNKNIGASTESRIAPPKTFAALSGKHDASARNIGVPNKKMLASSSGLQWSDNCLHGAAERVGASAKSVDATARNVDATAKSVDATARSVDATVRSVDTPAERAGATESRAAATDERAAATKKNADAS